MTKPSEQEAPAVKSPTEVVGWLSAEGHQDLSARERPAGEGMTEARLTELRDILESHGSFDCTDSAERAIIDSSVNALFSEVDRLRERERLLVATLNGIMCNSDDECAVDVARAAIGK